MTQAIGTPQGSKQASDKNAIRPFQVNVPEAELTDLRSRINSTKWPERELVADATQGVQLATVQALARYWGTEYDWRKVEARLNALPQFITEIDGLDIHFIHVRSKHEVEDCRSTHQSHCAWRERIGRLPSGDSVDAGLRLFREADRSRLGPRPHRACLGRADEAPWIHTICGARRRLGCAHHRSNGRAGASGIARHSHQHAGRGSKRH